MLGFIGYYGFATAPPVTAIVVCETYAFLLADLTGESCSSGAHQHRSTRTSLLHDVVQGVFRTAAGAHGEMGQTPKSSHYKPVTKDA